MTLTYSKRAKRESPYNSSVSVITWTFTTDGSGNATEENEVIWGVINRIVTIPDNVDTPTTLWDLSIADEDGMDLLCGNGADRDAANNGASEHIFPCPPNPGVASKLTFTVVNGGDTKKGIVKVYVI